MKIIDESHRIADELQHKRTELYIKEIAVIEAAYKAYEAACEDFARELRRLDDRGEGTDGVCSNCDAGLDASWNHCPICGRELDIYCHSGHTR